MTRTRADFERLIAELESDAADLSVVAAENTRAWERLQNGANDQLDWAALGYTIHNVYGVIENYCLRVAKFFENGLDRDGWHRHLLHRMTLAIGTLRPALFDSATYLSIDDLRSFRHLFRNLYARPLDPARTSLVQAKVGPAVRAFTAAHADFVRKLEVIAAALEQ